MNHKDWEETIAKVGVVVGCLIFQDGKYLLVEENPDGRVVWNLPAGHVDKGEQLEAAAIREAKEETGFDVKLGTQLGLYHESAPQSVKHVFAAEIIGGVATPQEGEIISVQWLSFDEISQLQSEGKIRAPWVWDAVQKHHAGI